MDEILIVSLNDSPRWKSSKSRGRLFRIRTVIKDEWCGLKIPDRNIIEYDENNIKYLLYSMCDITLIPYRVHPWTSTCIPPLLLWDQLCMPMMSVCSTSRLLKLIVVRISYQKLKRGFNSWKKTKKSLVSILVWLHFCISYKVSIIRYQAQL